MISHFSALAINLNFKRRVSWLENIPGQFDISHLKIFQYLGKWPGNSVHWISKNKAQPYKCTTVPQKQVTEEGAQNLTQIIGNVNKIDFENPLGIKVIRTAKYNFAKKKPQNKILLHSKTLLMTLKFLLLSYSRITSFNTLWHKMTTNLQISFVTLRNKCLISNHVCRMDQS